MGNALLGMVHSDLRLVLLPGRTILDGVTVLARPQSAGSYRAGEDHTSPLGLHTQPFKCALYSAMHPCHVDCVLAGLEGMTIICLRIENASSIINNMFSSSAPGNAVCLYRLLYGHNCT
jgi:hypothetical protein